MEIVYDALTSSPIGCINFFGITLLSSAQDLPSDTLCLVFERASEGTVLDFMNQKATSLEWADLIEMFVTIAHALEQLHSKKIVHRYYCIYQAADIKGSPCKQRPSDTAGQFFGP